MFKFERYKHLKKAIGAFAVLVSIIFGIWLILLMIGYHVDYPIFGIKLSFANYLRLLAEIVVGSLLLAAIAFL
jgi:hypothetical protein